MSDLWAAGMSGLLAPAGSAYSAQDLRKRIALAMLMKKQTAPKTLGEGLFSVGDSLSDALTARAIERQAGAESAKADTEIQNINTPPVAPTIGPRADLEDPAAAPSTVVPGVQPKIVAAPAPGAAPVPGAAPAPGGYRPAPAYLAGRLEELIPDPERRGYLGQLAGKEAQSPREVSSTGAAGPFQFTRGTGAQYGIPGDARFDVDKSIVAANRLTDDNAAVLTKALGRPPSPGELALAHQQGAGTAAKMLSGSGNAPAYNLAVNNAGGLPPQAAANKIMAYYGMPGAGGPGGARDAIAAASMPRPAAPPAPPVAPPAAPPAPQVAQAAPPPVAPQITPAPQPPQVRAAPEEYVPRDRPRPEPPAKPTMGPIEQEMTRKYLNADIDPRIKAAAAQRVEAERAQLNSIYENKLKNYTAEEKDWQKEREQERDYRMKLPGTRATTDKTQLEVDKARLELGGYPAQLVQERLKREAEVGKAQAEAEQKQEETRIVRRTGMEPVKLYERLDKEKASVDQTLKAQSAQQLARRAIKDGVITGYGANGVIASAKFADWAFKNGMSGNMAANTEIMSSALKSGLSEAVKTVNGEGGTGVSNTDVRIAEGISGSDPQLQMKTIKTIMDRAAEINHRKIDSYETKVDRYLSGEKAEDFYKIGGSTVPPDKLQILLTEPTDQRKAQFNDVYGPGAAELELARFKRAQGRKGF